MRKLVEGVQEDEIIVDQNFLNKLKTNLVA